MAARKRTPSAPRSSHAGPSTPETQTADGVRKPREIVAALIKRVDEALGEKLNASVADLVRLIQLQQELGEEAAEIRITWIDNL